MFSDLRFWTFAASGFWPTRDHSLAEVNSGLESRTVWVLMEDSLLLIKSSSSIRELTFYAVRENYFTVEFRSPELRAIREVYTYTDPYGLPNFLARIAAHNGPWPGSDDWSSLEGDFSISATCDRLGHVLFSLSIHDEFGALEQWRASWSITAELGQLPKLADDANRLFGLPPSA